MRAKSNRGQLGIRFFRPAALLFCACLSASAAQFQFNTLIRLGAPGGGSNWELGAGNNTGASPINTQTISPDWSSGASRQFQLTYDNTQHRMELRLFANNGADSTAFTYEPTSNIAPVNTVWTLPAASFFATALAGGNVYTAVNISGLSLTGLNGALNVLSPIQQTTMLAQSGFSAPSSTVTQSQDIVFIGDKTGRWRLQGYVTLNFFGLTGSSNQNLLQFGVSALANASPTPEPATWAMLATGLGAITAVARSKRA